MAHHLVLTVVQFLLTLLMLFQMILFHFLSTRLLPLLSSTRHNNAPSLTSIVIASLISTSSTDVTTCLFSSKGNAKPLCKICNGLTKVSFSIVFANCFCLFCTWSGNNRFNCFVKVVNFSLCRITCCAGLFLSIFVC